jgi:hypothetical protein
MAGSGAHGTASGVGGAAGCQEATTQQAAVATPGAPTYVDAIAGNGSVTVTWCPPADGQAHVVSYTVTSSSGRQSTAQLPNDYVIVDGLANGASYSFTVRANTASAAAPQSGASNGVTPAPIPEPRDVRLGQPQSVT